MTLPYLPRLLCLGLASFFLVHLVAALVTVLLTPRAVRTARSLAPGRAARFLLTIRLLPFGLAASVVLGLCVPSYLWLEPEHIEERTGFACLFTAMLGFAVCGSAILRGVRAAVRSALFIRRCRRSGREVPLSGKYPPAFVMEGPAPLLALAGIVRPRLVVSERILDTLSGEELSVVMRHERAHGVSLDNLKRLCIYLAPGVMPFFNGFGELDRSWISFAEYAADEAAVGGDARRSVVLANALVRVARLGTISRLSPVAISFLEDASELSTRVDRLLGTSRTSPSRESSHGAARYKFGGVLMLAVCLAPILFKPSTFRFVQSVLEHLIR